MTSTQITVKTKGHYDFVDITDKIQVCLQSADIKSGVAVLFVPGSTAALTTIEYEDGVMNDLKDVLEKIAPEDYDYKHHQKWGDHNGAAHIKSAIIGPDLTIPITDGKLDLGTWQQIVLIDFDEKPRTREIIVKIIKTCGGK